ncbi:MAG: M48 family metalloprotease [Candidatus Bathyarchaeota archaeon]|nr:M48 family metalloprotease [Candidatus Bathyarchaeota archaeon]
MAGLKDLKFAMGTSIFLASFIFGAFLLGVIFILQYAVLDFDVVTGVFLAVAGTVLFVLFQYALGPAIVSASTHLHYLKPGENPWLENAVKELAEKDGLPMPRLATVPNKAPNAFTFGRTSKSAVLAVHEGLLTSLNPAEIKAVLAHELGHIKHKDYAVMTVLSALPLIAYWISQIALRSVWFGGARSRRGRDEGNAGAALLAIGAISFVVYILSFLAVRRLSRLREHYADSYSAYLTSDPRGLQSALAKITYGLSIAPKAEGNARSFYIEDPTMARQEVAQIMEKKNEYDLDKDGVLDERELIHAMEKEAKSSWVKMNGLFATHPPTFKRILLLREIENEMATGTYSGDNLYAHV